MKTVLEVIVAAWIGAVVLVLALSIRKRRKAREKAADISHLQQYGGRQ